MSTPIVPLSAQTSDLSIFGLADLPEVANSLDFQGGGIYADLGRLFRTYSGNWTLLSRAIQQLNSQIPQSSIYTFVDAGSPGASYTPDVTGGGIYMIKILLTTNITINNPFLPAGPNGGRVRFALVQDATGGRTITWGTQWQGLGGSSSSTAPNSYSIFEFDFIPTEGRVQLTFNDATGYSFWS